MKPNATAYKLTLTPLADPTDQDGIRRLRGLLKVALRQYRLRCVALEPAIPNQPGGKLVPILTPKAMP